MVPTPLFQRHPLRWAIISLGFGLTLSPLASQAEQAALKEIEVKADRVNDTQPVKGYQAKRSSTATKTDTPLLDVPQTVTVVTREQMQDSAVQSISDVIRYVPGVTISQGEGNRDAINFRGAGVSTGDFYLDGCVMISKPIATFTILTELRCSRVPMA